MKKENKIRLIIWGIIWFFIFIAFSSGIYLYYTGHGSIGKIRSELKPIVETFNSLNGLNIYKNADIDINAKLYGKSIVIRYKTLSSNLSYKFEYDNISNNRVLHLKYKESSENISFIIIKEMLEAVSVYTGHVEGKIFNNFELEDLYKTTLLDDGVVIKKDDSFIEVFINIDKSLADSNYKKEVDYIIDDEIKNMNDILETEHSFNYTKKDIKIYIKDESDKYILYVQNTSYNNDLYKSILSIIKLLNIESSIKTDFELNYPSITESKQFGNYIIEVDTTNYPENIFITNNNIIKIEITK